jgi:DNA-directed RNA polymerase subunit RPC12/RpoP
MAKPELAGQNVQCPTCGQTFQVPVAVAAPQQPKSFQVACACGRTYQVQPAMAGRPVRCQSCGQKFVVPQPPGARPQTAAAPVVQRPDPLADPLGDLGDLSSFGDPLGGTVPAAGLPSQSLPTSYAPAGGVARPKTKRRAVNNSKVISIIVSVLVVLAILGIAVGTFVFFPFGRGYATPEAVWQAYKKAAENEDWRTLYNTLTPQTRDRMLGGLVLMAQMVGANDERVAAIAEKHGLNTSAPDAGGIGQMFSQMNQLDSLGNEIKNKQAFFVDMMKYFAEKGEEMREKMGGRQQMTMMNASQELKDVVIEGDSARGMQTVSLSGNTVEVPIEFRKIDGGWLIHQPSFQEAANRPPADNDPFGGPAPGSD